MGVFLSKRGVRGFCKGEPGLCDPVWMALYASLPIVTAKQMLSTHIFGDWSDSKAFTVVRGENDGFPFLHNDMVWE